MHHSLVAGTRSSASHTGVTVEKLPDHDILATVIGICEHWGPNFPTQFSWCTIDMIARALRAICRIRAKCPVISKFLAELNRFLTCAPFPPVAGINPNLTQRFVLLHAKFCRFIVNFDWILVVERLDYVRKIGKNLIIGLFLTA